MKNNNTENDNAMEVFLSFAKKQHQQQSGKGKNGLPFPWNWTKLNRNFDPELHKNIFVE